MGRPLLPPDCITLPMLSRTMGRHVNTLYDALRRGKGPVLREVKPVPGSYPAPGSKRSHYVSIPAAIAWLESRPDAEKWADVIRSLKVLCINQYILAGVPLPRPPQTPYRAPSNALGASFGGLRP
jgi:hypothetical protein